MAACDQRHAWPAQRRRRPCLADHEETTFFLGDYSTLKRDYLPDDYRCDAAGFEVVATVHVEAEWDRQRQVAETEWLHAINATHGLPNVVVGHVWLAADNCEAVLRDHMQYPLFRGVRSKPVTSLTPDTMTPGAPGTIQDPAWRKGLALLETLGLTYDLRVPYWHLDEAAEAISQHPNLPVVLNHTGFPWDRSDAGILSWKKGMKAIATCPNVQVKLSEFGLKDAPWTIEGNRGVVLDAVEIFGVERCMWASNFPVAALRIGYRAQLEGMLEILKGLSSDDLDQIFRRNAATFYGITLD
jgi:predicted TIM-barrel fold metal-dependent hydrolase